MVDNGIMQYYREHRTKLGYLKTRELPFPQYYGKDEEEYLEFMKTPSQLYFKKEVDKDACDAEVLLSQIYKKAGFDTALYFPALDKRSKHIVLSNDVRSATSIDAFQLHKKIGKENPGYGYHECVPQKGEFPFILPEYLTENAIRNIFRMNAFDVGSFNTDRHFANYIYDYPNALGQYNDIKLFDYGQSGYIFSGSTSGFLSQRDVEFPNLFFTGDEKTYEQMIWQLRHNDTVKQYISSHQLAEELGNVDVAGTAQEIKETLNYTVHPQYVEFLTQTFDQAANDLAK
ncbi:MAG: hypothetical protein IKI95_01160 [Clostridia bacterium]|nr:hypothetical protein [Clostridia bacterium]